MDYRQALKETMFRFEIKGVELAQASGVRGAQISAFRSGRKDLYVVTFEQIIKAMPREAQIYFYQLVSHSIPETPVLQGVQAPPPPPQK